MLLARWEGWEEHLSHSSSKLLAHPGRWLINQGPAQSGALQKHTAQDSRVGVVSTGQTRNEKRSPAELCFHARQPFCLQQGPNPSVKKSSGTNESSTRHLSVTCLSAFKQKRCSNVGQTLAWGVCVTRLRTLGNPVFWEVLPKRLYWPFFKRKRNWRMVLKLVKRPDLSFFFFWFQKPLYAMLSIS